MDNGFKKARRRMIAGILIDMAVWFAIVFSTEDSPVLDVAYTIFAMVIMTLIMLKFIKIIANIKMTVAAPRIIKPIGSENERELRRVTIMISRRLYAGKLKILVDGVETAKVKGGDYLIILLTKSSHALNVRAPGISTEKTIPAGDEDCGFYIWVAVHLSTVASLNRAIIKVEHVANGFEEIEAREIAQNKETFEGKNKNVTIGSMVFLTVVMVLIVMIA